MSPQAMAHATGALDQADVLKLEQELQNIEIDPEK